MRNLKIFKKLKLSLKKGIKIKQSRRENRGNKN